MKRASLLDTKKQIKLSFQKFVGSVKKSQFVEVTRILSNENEVIRATSQSCNL